MKKPIAVTLEEKIIELMNRKCEELNMNRSAFVEYVLRQYFGLYPKLGGGVDGKS
jgi:metal-responsive CopG/Arc/MetJ family transcriptional regulator